MPGALRSRAGRVAITRPTVAGVLAALAALPVLVGLARLGMKSGKYSLAGGLAVLGLGLYAIDPVAIPLIAIIGTGVVARLGGSSTNLSVSDALLFVATLAALPFVRTRESPVLRRLLWLIVLYESMTLLAVINHPYRADWIEWIHEAFLSAGALIVGWVVGRAGRTRDAYSGLLIAGCVVSVLAIKFSLTNHFAAANLPGGYQKNFIGDWLACTILVAIANPPYIGWNERLRKWGLVVCLAGLAASGSRQAIGGLFIAGAVVKMRGAGHRWRKIVPLGLVVLGGIGYELHKQLISSNRFNSAHQRLTWYKQSIQLLDFSPLLGEGFRWWYTPRFTFAFAPPNAELEMLTSAGLVGLLAFLILHPLASPPHPLATCPPCLRNTRVRGPAPATLPDPGRPVLARLPKILAALDDRRPLARGAGALRGSGGGVAPAGRRDAARARTATPTIDVAPRAELTVEPEPSSPDALRRSTPPELAETGAVPPATLGSSSAA